MNTMYFGDLTTKLSNSAKMVAGINNQNEVLRKAGVYAPILDHKAAEKSIKKAHAKFYGQNSKYDGKGNLREVL